jgi:hypothetical protein
MQVRPPLAILALLAAFAGGVAMSHLIEREARAQSGPQGASVIVPTDGLTFRAVDGRIVARLSYDAHGGAFEVYDGRERPAGALRSGPAAEAPRPASVAPASTVATVASPDVDLGY